MNADPEEAYTALCTSFEPTDVVLKKENRCKLYFEDVLFSKGINNTTTTSFQPRRILVFDDAIVVAAATATGLVVEAEIPLEGIEIEDCFHRASALESSITAEVQQQQQQQTITLKPSSSSFTSFFTSSGTNKSTPSSQSVTSSGEGRGRSSSGTNKSTPSASTITGTATSVPNLSLGIALRNSKTSYTTNAVATILVAASLDEKKTFLHNCSLVLHEVVPATSQLENKHWIYRYMLGSLHWCAFTNAEASLKALLPQPTPTATTLHSFTTQPPFLDINATDAEGNTALHLATSQSNREIVNILLEAGALMEVNDADYNTPLHLACLAGHSDIVSILVVNGSSLEIRNLLEQTPLAAVLQYALDNDAPPTAFTRLSLEKAQKNVMSMVELLLAYGAATSDTDAEGLTPLHRVATTLHFEGLVRCFVRHGAAVNASALVMRQVMTTRTATSSSTSSSSSSNRNGAGDNDDNAIQVSVCEEESLSPLHLACGALYEGDSRKPIVIRTKLTQENQETFLKIQPISVNMIQALLAVGCQPNAKTGRSSTGGGGGSGSGSSSSSSSSSSGKTPLGETPLHIILRALASLPSPPSLSALPTSFEGDKGTSAQHQEEEEELAITIARAELHAAASLLCSYGARLDIQDQQAEAGGGATMGSSGGGSSSKSRAATAANTSVSTTCSDLAASIGGHILPKLQASCALFASKTLPQSAFNTVGNSSGAGAAATMLSMDAATRKNAEDMFSDLSTGGRTRAAYIASKGGKTSMWVKDTMSDSCSICESGFTFARRRHHCRRCGALVCNSCSTKRFPLTVVSRDPDSDDDDAVNAGVARLGNKKTNPTLSSSSSTSNSSSSSSSSSLSGFFTSVTSSIAKAGMVLGGGGGEDDSDAQDRVCDGCYNALCSFAEIAAEEERLWRLEKQRHEKLNAKTGKKEVGGGSSSNKISTAASSSSSSSSSSSAPIPRSSTSGSNSELSPEEQRSALFSKQSGGRTGGGGGGSTSSTTVQATTGALQQSLGDAKDKLALRGEKLSRLDEKMRDMSAAAKDFSSMANQLKKKQSSWW